MHSLACYNCVVCQTWMNVARIRVKMVAHASMASTSTRAAVKLATLGGAAKQVRTIDAKVAVQVSKFYADRLLLLPT